VISKSGVLNAETTHIPESLQLAGASSQTSNVFVKIHGMSSAQPQDFRHLPAQIDEQEASLRHSAEQASKQPEYIVDMLVDADVQVRVNEFRPQQSSRGA
jgi:hypothetical protein